MGYDDIPLNDQTIRWAIGKLRDHTEIDYSGYPGSRDRQAYDEWLKTGFQYVNRPLFENEDHVIIRALITQQEADFQIGDYTWDHTDAGVTIYWTEHEDPDHQFPRRSWRQYFVDMDFGQLIGEITSA